MNSLIVREIENQLSLDSELLYRMLGASQSLGATPGTARDGKVMLANTQRNLRDRICADKNIERIYKAAQHSKVQLAAAVLDCIAGAVTGVSPITVAVLIVKEGVHLLCENAWKNAD
jgi:hypothetical protein